MSDPASQQNPARVLRKFNSFDEQEVDILRHWMTRSVAEKLEAAADLARSAYSIQPTGEPEGRASSQLPQVSDKKGGLMRQSRVLRKFGSFEEQEAWNFAYARPR